MFVTYNLSGDTGTGLNVVFEVSADNGTTWTVPATSVSGEIGIGQTEGVGKSLQWDAGVDFNNQFETDMMVRIRATDSLENQGEFAMSSAFTLDTLEPVIVPVQTVSSGGGGSCVGTECAPVLPTISVVIPSVTPVTPEENVLRDVVTTLTLPTVTSEGIIVSPPVSITPPTIVLPPVPVISPSAEAIQEVTSAVELPGLAAPAITTAIATTATGVSAPIGGTLFRFSGTTTPNARVAVYLHSSQALIYQTTANEAGVWTAEHSQENTELAEGDHSIYAVMLDAKAGVKSPPSDIRFFSVQKNIWAQLFGYLNLYTTLVALGVLAISVIWLSFLKRRGVKQV